MLKKKPVVVAVVNKFFSIGIKNMLLMYSNDDNNGLDDDL